jgi:hypothetical protein
MAILKGGSQDDLTIKYLLENNKTDVSGIEAELQNIEEQLGDTPLPTTAQTITGAIDEHETDISNIAQDVDNATLKIIAITLPYSNWQAHSTLTDVFTQTVTISGSTNKTKVDLQADASTLLQLISDGVLALYIENDNAVFKAYAIGAAPTANLTVQGTCVETE